MTNTISRKSLVLTPVLYNLMEFFEKLYCFPSQEKILQLMKKTTGTEISRAQLNRDLRDLEDHQIIKRTRRHHRHPQKGMQFRSTLYEITWLGFHQLRMIGRITWDQLNRIKGILNRGHRPKASRPGSCDSIGNIMDNLGFSGDTEGSASLVPNGSG